MLRIPTKTKESTESKTLVAKLRVEDRAKIKAGDKLMILVSVGKENFNPEATRAIVKLLNEIYDEVGGGLEFVFNVADTLQRFNLAALSRATPESQLRESIAGGDKWLSDVAPSLAELKGTKHIIRWEYWRQHASYAVAREKVLSFAAEHPETFRTVMDKSVNEYIERQKRDLGEDVFAPIEAKYREYCGLYLQEEITTMLLWVETGCAFNLYPGKQTGIMSIISEKFYPKSPALLQWLDVRLQRVDLAPVRAAASSLRISQEGFTAYFSSMLDMQGVRLAPEIKTELIPLCVTLATYITSQPSAEQRSAIQFLLLQLANPAITFCPVSSVRGVSLGSFWATRVVATPLVTTDGDKLVCDTSGAKHRGDDSPLHSPPFVSPLAPDKM